MGLSYSSQERTLDSSLDASDDVLDMLRKTDPALYERLLASVTKDIEDKHTRHSAPVPKTRMMARSMPVGQVKAPKLSDYAFPFENVVFEGGGSKGRIYLGALKCLEEAGIKAKRFAGASAGAMTAALLAVNIPANEAEKYMSQDLQSILEDHSYGYMSFFPNLLRYFGWNPGQKFLDYFGKILEDHTGNKDITFEEVYRKYGNELCVVAVNTNIQAAEYFHVKTSPQMPIRLAVRMSMSIPGFFAAVPKTDRNGRTDYYIDGGVICNYPVHVFDGWWLSMLPNDSFYKRLRPLSDIPKLMDKAQRFGAFNEKTLGFLVYATGEDEIAQVEFEKRIARADINVPRPDTKLYRKWRDEFKGKYKPLLAHAAFTRATDKLVEALRDADIANDDNATISKSEFQSVFADIQSTADINNDKFCAADATLLFGKDYDISKIFDSLDLNKDGVIDYAELCVLLDKSLGVNRRFLGYGRREISTLADFGSVLFAAIQMQSMKIYMTGRDLDRTIGLDTSYIGTMNFTLEEADANFLTQQGYEITKAFLLDYAATNKLEKRKP